MTKKSMGIIVVFISLLMAVSLSAKGPQGGINGQSLGNLTDKEIEHITYIRQEEKLARDVYSTLNEKYEAPIFANISESEQRHMDALKKLIDKYGLEDPVEDDTVGLFPTRESPDDTDFNVLYNDLVEQGSNSYCDALQVGIDIENLDIKDIETALDGAEARDVTRVFNNLLSGSYNHLNAFTSQQATAGCN